MLDRRGRDESTVSVDHVVMCAKLHTTCLNTFQKHTYSVCICKRNACVISLKYRFKFCTNTLYRSTRTDRPFYMGHWILFTLCFLKISYFRRPVIRHQAFRNRLFLIMPLKMFDNETNKHNISPLLIAVFITNSVH